MSDYEEIQLPVWLQHILKEGDEVGFNAPLGNNGPIEWTLNGQPVSEPKDSL